VQGKRARRNGRRKGAAGATRARYRPSEKRSTEMNEQNDLDAFAKKIEEKVNAKVEAEKREAKLSDNDKKRIEEIISLFNGLERRGVLSYRVEAPVKGKPPVLRFAIKNGEPIIITVSANKVSFEKFRPDGGRESLKASGISNPSGLTKNNMMTLIDKILEE
jgi:hypothetical protein